MVGLSAEPACELVTVATDLSRPCREPLLAAGFDPQRPATWVMEGLLPYLDAAAQLAVLEEVAALSASGSRVVIERAVPLPKTDDLDAKLRELCSAYGRSLSLTETTEAESTESESTRSGPEPTEGSGEPAQSRGGFVTAWRQ